MSTGLDLLKAEIDQTRSGSRRWYVAGYGRFWFTSREDAEAAIELAKATVKNERYAIGQSVRNALAAST